MSNYNPLRILYVQRNLARQNLRDLAEIRYLFGIAVEQYQWEMDFLQRDLGLRWLVV